MLFGPARFDLCQDRLALGHVFFDDVTHFLFHGPAVPLGERLERLHDARRDVSNGERGQHDLLLALC